MKELADRQEEKLFKRVAEIGGRCSPAGGNVDGRQR